MATKPTKAANAKTPPKYKTKVGRPQKFDEAQALRFFNEVIAQYRADKLSVSALLELGENKMIRIGKAYPSLINIAIKCGVTRETLTANCTARNEDGSLKNVQLFDAYQQFKQIGEDLLIRGGLEGVYNANVVQFVGNVNYGMIPNQKVEQEVKVSNMDAIYQELDSLHFAELERVNLEREKMATRKALLDLEDDE